MAIISTSDPGASPAKAWRARSTGSGHNSPRQSTVLAGAELFFMSELITRLIRTTMNIALLKQGPQDMPPGTVALMLAVSFYVVAVCLSFSLGRVPDHALATVLLSISLPALSTAIVLWVCRRSQRWPQTLAALFASGGLLTVLSIPLSAGSSAQPGLLAALAGLTIFVWSFAIDAHIWRHALDVSFAAGLAVAAILFFVSIYFISTIAGTL